MGIHSVNVYELPEWSIREMIANAVIHRSYMVESSVQVSVYDDRIEVDSPGMLYDGLDIERAMSGTSRCRNAAIAEAFKYMGIVDKWGTGIPRILRECEEYELPELEFEESGDGIRVIMYRKVSNAEEKVSNTFEKYAAMLTQEGVGNIYIRNIEKVYSSYQNDPFGQTNVMVWLECSKSKATNIMNSMKRAKIVEAVKGYGAGKYKFVSFEELA